MMMRPESKPWSDIAQMHIERGQQGKACSKQCPVQVGYLQKHRQSNTATVHGGELSEHKDQTLLIQVQPLPGD